LLISSSNLQRLRKIGVERSFDARGDAYDTHSHPCGRDLSANLRPWRSRVLERQVSCAPLKAAAAWKVTVALRRCDGLRGAVADVEMVVSGMDWRRLLLGLVCLVDRVVFIELVLTDRRALGDTQTVYGSSHEARRRGGTTA
jgi:hypothetical protein